MERALGLDINSNLEKIELKSVRSIPGRSGLTRRRKPIARCEGWKTEDGPCLASSTGRIQDQIETLDTKVWSTPHLKSAPREDFFYVAMLSYISCFPSCQEGFFNVE